MSINGGAAGEALFGRIRRELLNLFLFNPERSFYLLELVSILRTGRGGVQRELANLVSAGIVSRRKSGVKVLFTLSDDSEVLPELGALLAVLSDQRSALDTALDRLKLPVSIAVLKDGERGKTSAPSRLLLVCGHEPVDLEEELEVVQLIHGGVIDATVLRPEEVAEAVGRDTLSWAMSPAADFLRGSREELEAMVGSDTEEEGEPDLFSAAGLSI